MWKRFTVALVAALGFAGAPAQAQLTVSPTLRINPGVVGAFSLKLTNFQPQVHGYKFANTFTNNFISEFDVRTQGLCGGMVWSALDYYTAGKPIPQQTYAPAEGARLQSYIYNRQVHSLANNADKWAEFIFNPGGARNDEFWRWGLEGKPGGRIDELRRLIDAGKPAPLGLLGCDEGCKGDHQVLAIGYDLGRYKGDLGQYQSDFKILVYDPNFPGETLVMRANLAEKKYFYESRPDQNWRSYFVDSKWRVSNPPDVGLLPRELLLTFRTGGDDLRGGNDNVHAVFRLRDGTERRFDNVNQRKRWVNNSTQTIAIALPAGVQFDDVVAIRLETTFGGGMGGDNWNLDWLRVEASDEAGRRELLYAEGTPLMRFTGDRKTGTWNF